MLGQLHLIVHIGFALFGKNIMSWALIRLLGLHLDLSKLDSCAVGTPNIASNWMQTLTILNFLVSQMNNSFGSQKPLKKATLTS